MSFVIILGIFMFMGAGMGMGIVSLIADDWQQALDDCTLILIPSEYDYCMSDVRMNYGMYGFLPIILAVMMMLPAGLFRDERSQSFSKVSDK